MDLIDQVRRLQVLAALNETGSFSAAARALGMTQSGASQHLAALERDLDLALVDRRLRPVELTEIGLRLARHGRVLRSQLDLAEQEVLELAGRRKARLRLGAFPSALTTFVPAALNQFRTTHPEVEVTLVDGHMPQLLRIIESGEVDLALVYGQEDVPGSDSGGIVGSHLRDDVYRIVLPRDHRLARKRSLRLVDLADETWVGSRSGVWFRIVAAACRLEGFTPSVALGSDDYLAVQALVAATLGVAVIPGLAVRPSRQLASIPITGRPVIRRIWAVRSSTTPASRAADELVATLRDSAAGFESGILRLPG